MCFYLLSRFTISKDFFLQFHLLPMVLVLGFFTISEYLFLQQNLKGIFSLLTKRKKDDEDLLKEALTNDAKKVKANEEKEEEEALEDDQYSSDVSDASGVSEDIEEIKKAIKLNDKLPHHHRNSNTHLNKIKKRYPHIFEDRKDEIATAKKLKEYLLAPPERKEPETTAEADMPNESEMLKSPRTEKDTSDVLPSSSDNSDFLDMPSFLDDLE